MPEYAAGSIVPSPAPLPEPGWKRAAKALQGALNWIVLLAAAGGAIYGVVRWIESHSTDPRSRRYVELSHLAVGTTAAEFQHQLGPPVATDRVDPYQESIYWDAYFYVQALSDSQGLVVAYSVTTRRRDFRPRVPGPSYSDLGKNGGPIALGGVHFSELREPGAVSGFLFLGSRFFGYSEHYWIGDASVDPSVALSLVDAGVVNYDNRLLADALLKLPFAPGGNVRLLDASPSDAARAALADYLRTPEADANRRAAVVNTYTVLLPEVDFDSLSVQNALGAQKSKVSTLP